MQNVLRTVVLVVTLALAVTSCSDDGGDFEKTVEALQDLP